MKGLFSVVSSKFKPCYNQIVIPLQYLKLQRKAVNLPRSGWADCEQKAAKWEYREDDRLLTEQFIDGLNQKGMTDEILREVAMLDDIEEATNEHILTWVHCVEAQRAQRITLNSSKKAEVFDVIWQNTRNVNERPCGVTNASVVGQDMHPSSALHMGRMWRIWQSQPFHGGLHILMETTGELLGQEGSWWGISWGQD